MVEDRGEGRRSWLDVNVSRAGGEMVVAMIVLLVVVVVVTMAVMVIGPPA